MSSSRAWTLIYLRYHAYWCHGSSYPQFISNHAVDFVVAPRTGRTSQLKALIPTLNANAKEAEKSTQAALGVIINNYCGETNPSSTKKSSGFRPTSGGVNKLISFIRYSLCPNTPKHCLLNKGDRPVLCLDFMIAWRDHDCIMALKRFTDPLIFWHWYLTGADSDYLWRHPPGMRFRRSEMYFTKREITLKWEIIEWSVRLRLQGPISRTIFPSLFKGNLVLV